MTPSKVLLEKLNKLKECLVGTTAALAPYPVEPVTGKKRKKEKDGKIPQHRSENL